MHGRAPCGSAWRVIHLGVQPIFQVFNASHAQPAAISTSAMPPCLHAGNDQQHGVGHALQSEPPTGRLRLLRSTWQLFLGGQAGAGKQGSNSVCNGIVLTYWLA